MKLKFLVAAISASIAMPALAQSSVTLYGLLDIGVHMADNGGKRQTKLVSGIADGSRIGFKGTEDLGDGYKAIFNLESRIEIDNGGNRAGNISDYQGFALSKGMNFPDFGSPVLKGAAAQTLAGVRAALQPKYNVNTLPEVLTKRGAGPDGGMFDRAAYVGLVTPVGAVLAGRMYTPAYEIFNNADAFESGMAGSWGNLAMGTGGLITTGMAIRSNKSVQYRMELPSGIGASLLYGFKNSGYIGLDNKFLAANFKYKANGFNVGIGYNRGYNEDDSVGLETTTVGGNYTTGDFKFFAGYQKAKNEKAVLLPAFNSEWDTAILPTLKAGGVPDAVLAAWTSVFKTNLAKNFKLDANQYTLGMHYQIGNGRIMASATRQDDRTLSNSDATQYAIGYNYNLSKRTDVYSVVGLIKNENDAQYAGGAASAPGGFTLKAGQDARTFQFGIRHRF